MNFGFDTYISVKDWYESMKTHPCKKRVLFQEDDPKNRVVGAHCSGCGRSFQIDLLFVKSTAKECGRKMMDMLRTPDSRRELISSLSDK